MARLLRSAPIGALAALALGACVTATAVPAAAQGIAGSWPQGGQSIAGSWPQGEKRHKVSFLKEYTVFNIAQRAGLPESCLSGDAPAINQDQRDAAAQAILSIVVAPPSGFALPAV
jgi:antirestriction protein ArdC